MKHSFIANTSSSTLTPNGIAQFAEAVEYTECISAEGLDPTNECPGYDTKQSDGEAPLVLEISGMQSTPSLPSFPGLLGSWVKTLNVVLSIAQIELNYVLIQNRIDSYNTVLILKLVLVV